MTKHFKDYSPNMLDSFLDNLLNDEEQLQFLHETDDVDQVQQQKQLQEQIDQRLQQLFHCEPLTFASDVDVADRPANSIAGRRLFSGLTLAISLLILASTAYWISSFQIQNLRSKYQPEQLAKIYRQSVERGFRPDYECHDMQKFADVFERRIDQRIILGTMPADRRMLGVSHLGGKSRDITAVLFVVKDQPVIVFVDRLSGDLPDAGQTDPNSELNIFREEKDGLVYCEVTPAAEPGIIRYFQPD